MDDNAGLNNTDVCWVEGTYTSNLVYIALITVELCEVRAEGKRNRQTEGLKPNYTQLIRLVYLCRSRINIV